MIDLRPPDSEADCCAQNHDHKKAEVFYPRTHGRGQPAWNLLARAINTLCQSLWRCLVSGGDQLLRLPSHELPAAPAIGQTLQRLLISSCRHRRPNATSCILGRCLRNGRCDTTGLKAVLEPARPDPSLSPSELPKPTPGHPGKHLQITCCGPVSVTRRSPS